MVCVCVCVMIRLKVESDPKGMNVSTGMVQGDGTEREREVLRSVA